MAAITRTQFRNGLFDHLDAQKTATPGLLRAVARYRPGSVTERPSAWVADIAEQLGYDQGTRAHRMVGEVEIATAFATDLVTNNDPFDQLIDALLERATSQATSFIPNTIFQLDQIAEGEITVRGTEADSVYRGVTLTYSLQIWEGRI